MAENVWASLSNQLAETAANVGQSVVAVCGHRHVSSGILWHNDAVVTASHGLRRDDDLTVILAPNEKLAARVAGRDAGTDLAVLRLEKSVSASPVRWANLPHLRVGELVLALGRSRRGNIVASSGILSGIIAGPWRTWRGGEIDQFIRPDLVFYPGFSGGPLVNSQGEIVGMNTSGLHKSGITIPAATLAHVVPELLQKGHVERPYLGLAMQTVPLPESLQNKLNLKGSEGLLIVHVDVEGPAEKAGMLLGDVLVELEGKAVVDTDDVQEALRTRKVGGSVEVTLVRAGVLTKITAALAARPAR